MQPGTAREPRLLAELVVAADGTVMTETTERTIGESSADVAAHHERRLRAAFDALEVASGELGN